MKVALYGNMCNNFYTLAKALRNSLGIEAHLYLHDQVDFQHKPESDDPELAGNYPDWIHVSPKWNTLPYLKKRDRSFIRELNKYDVVFLSDLGPVMAPEIKGYTIFYSTGSDLTTVPFPKKFAFKFKTFKDRIVWEYIGYMQRKGIRSCTKIFTQPFYPFANALKEIGVAKERIANCYFPILMDLDVVKATEDPWSRIDDYNKKQLEPFNFIIFHPSRLVIRKNRALVDSGHWKGNDALFKGLAIFKKKYNVEDVCIAMPDRIYSVEIPIAKEIISSLGLDANIVWLKPPTPEGFPRQQLMDYYTISDINTDEFATGWFGSIVVEGMACGKPTFCYVDETVMKQLYPWHPVISVLEPEDIAEQIARFYFNRELGKEVGARSREWVVEYHSITKGSEIYINNLKKELAAVFQEVA